MGGARWSVSHLTLFLLISGLVPAAVAVHLYGQGGAVLLLIMIFMAVTSTGSAEQLAVSSLISYDVYKGYYNKKATGKDVIAVSRITVVVYGFFMGFLAVALFRAGLSLDFVYRFMGVVIGSAVFPIYACLTWAKCTATAAISGNSRLENMFKKFHVPSGSFECIFLY